MNAAELRWETSGGPPAPACGETQVLAFDADDPSLDPDALTQVLSEDERARAGRLVGDVDRRRFIAGRALLRRTLARCTCGDPARIRFSYAAHGKPELGGGGLTALRFSVSGSEGLVLIALRHGGDVGVDVEAFRDVRPAVEDAALTPQERARLESLPAETRRSAFFAAWAGKEAVSKALGQGLGLRFGGLELPPGAGRVPLPPAAAIPDVWLTPLPAPRPGFAAALACAGSPGAVRLWSSLPEGSRRATT